VGLTVLVMAVVAIVLGSLLFPDRKSSGEQESREVNGHAVLD